ncbi:MAG: tRNA (adenosine(37)-N6)-threonylcarbamoyltransferase complex ATPase subunit type 1 TsaE [Gemmatimonadetes bacterium]|nr:tRNA (adenosine(37)-N6)-threonylcarbamoyltransferase complex ATPase subunit type 1 TsaE [Gemmatimonadota bacterium]MDA1104598.1 tRNA (adenosine(37)-N6)-threonylcarbamoyltransferase complex ATPase subunit type 1 TsaE [Gemmatimonadota bacterium]
MRLDEIELAGWGERIGETVGTPTVIALQGPLGAGKSVLARAIGRGAGVRETMPSPSYNLLFRYVTDSRTEVVHLDLYRIESSEELWELGWAQIPGEADLVLVEWPERAKGALPVDHWVIELSAPGDQPLLRDVEVRRVGSPSELAAFPMSVSGSRR